MRSSSAAAGSSDLGWDRLAPFGVPVVPEVRMIALPARGGRDDVGAVARLDDLVQGLVLARALDLPTVVPADVAQPAPAGVVQDLGELLVVDQRLGLLALADLGQLRAGEGVLRNIAFAPSFEQATIASTKPRWLRIIRPTLSPSLTPSSERAWAIALERSWTSGR